MRKDKLEIFYADPRTLSLYKNNAKMHDDKQIAQIVRSIKEFGFNDPIAVDEDNTIIEGHGRCLAALEMGLDSVPVFRLTGLTEEERKAYALVHNQLTLNSGFDIDLLEAELDKITDIDMTAYSFAESETFFDPESNYEREAKGEVVVVTDKDEAEEIEEWLDERLIDYKKTDAW